MTVYVEPHEHVQFEGAWVAAARAQIEGRAAAKKDREFRAANADADAILKFIARKAFTWASDVDWHLAGYSIQKMPQRNFFDKIHASVDKWGAPTQGQADAIRRIMEQETEKKAQWAARDARSEHIGNVGDKIEVEAVVYFQTSYSTQWGVTEITGFRSGDNIIIHKGTAPSVNKGDRVILKATVKEHGERDGVKQTIVTRPKAKVVGV